MHEGLPTAVDEAFRKASMFNLMLVARARATRVTYLLSDKLQVPGDIHRVSQGYVKGNVAILP
jgi:hypothetical protein